MKPRVLLTPFLITGCGGVGNTFEVRAPGASSVELQLCGQVIRLEQSDGRFAATRKIACEGDGKVVVRSQGRPDVSCVVGYVTPGAVQRFRFKVDEDQMQPFALKRGVRPRQLSGRWRRSRLSSKADLANSSGQYQERAWPALSNIRALLVAEIGQTNFKTIGHFLGDATKKLITNRTARGGPKLVALPLEQPPSTAQATPVSVVPTTGADVTERRCGAAKGRSVEK